MDSLINNTVLSYMDKILMDILKPSICNRDVFLDSDKASTEIFKILSSREFTYFTRVKSEPHRNNICTRIMDAYNGKRKLNFYFNIGGGYHAKILNDLFFEPELSEFLMLYQIKKFIDKVSIYYPFGISFKILIDNRSAELANNISIEKTSNYRDKLDEMIKALNLDKYIELVLESDTISREEFEKRILLFEKNNIDKTSDKNYLNAVRFCENLKKDDVIISAKRYKIINKVTRANTTDYSKDGIYISQRAKETSFPFRSFPGGDCKIQCGRMALFLNNNLIKRPLLITTANLEKFDLIKLDLPDRFLIPYLFVATSKI